MKIKIKYLIKMVSVKFSKSEIQNKRMTATFYDDAGKKKKTVQFGYKGGSTFIDHKNEDTKKAWIARHQIRGKFEIYDTPSALARWILWEEKNLQDAIRKYKKKFNLS